MTYHQIKTSYLVIAPNVWEQRFQVALNMRGATMTGFVNEVLRDYFVRNTTHYIDVAKIDAEARGYPEGSEYFRDLLAGELRPWSRQGIRPDYPPSPLKRIADAGEVRKNQRRLKQIRLSEYHAACLRLAMVAEGLTLVSATSRVVNWHLLEYWDVKGGYQWQIQGAEAGAMEVSPSQESCR